MRVFLKLNFYGEKGYHYPGLKRMPAIIRAINEYRNDVIVSSYTLIGIRTSKIKRRNEP